MDKKKGISWGVSFGSLALVAGMVSYLGLSNGGKTNGQTTANQPLPSNNQQNQQSQGQLFTQPGDNSSSADSSQFNFNDGSTNNNFDDNNQFSDNNNGQNQFSNGGPSFRGGHNRGFDTTTGGT